MASDSADAAHEPFLTWFLIWPKNPTSSWKSLSSS